MDSHTVASLQVACAHTASIVYQSDVHTVKHHRRQGRQRLWAATVSQSLSAKTAKQAGDGTVLGRLSPKMYWAPGFVVQAHAAGAPNSFSQRPPSSSGSLATNLEPAGSAVRWSSSPNSKGRPRWSPQSRSSMVRKMLPFWNDTSWILPGIQRENPAGSHCLSNC